MKRQSLAIIFACCALALVAQDVIKVNYKGSKPTISDFAWAFLSDYVYNENDDDCLALQRRRDSHASPEE